MPPEPQDQILFAKGTRILEVAAYGSSHHHDPLMSILVESSTTAKESQLDGSTPLDGSTYSPSKQGPESMPLYEARPPSFIG